MITIKSGLSPLMNQAHDVTSKRHSINSALNRLVNELQQEHWQPYVQEANGREVVVRIHLTSQNADQEYETQYTGSDEEMEQLRSVALWYINTANNGSLQAKREARTETDRWKDTYRDFFG